MKKIVQKEDPVLHKIAIEVPIPEITSPKIQKIIKEMSASLKSQHDGVAIAAPQIGYSLRIFVVSGRIFEADFLSKEEKKEKEITIKDLVFINPKLSKLSREKEWLPEGCLSVRWLYGKTYRSKKAFAEAYDEKGVKFKMGASGLLAQIFQHETDHLNGILFHEHAKDLREEPPQNEQS